MGKTIVSWSPVHGQGATTSNLAALASSFALDYSATNLITHTQLNFSSLETLSGKNLVADGFEESGIAALERLAKSSLLKPAAVMDYTEAIYRHRLDILGGKKSIENYEHLMEVLLAVTKDAYDVSWVDAHSGTRNQLTHSLLESADIVLVNLPQNRFVLDRFFSGEDFPEVLKMKKCIYLISCYDSNSSFSLRKIKRCYKITQPTFAVPISTYFKDAANSMKLSEFFYKNMDLDKQRPMYEFLYQLKKINKFIAKEIGLNRQVDEEDED